MSETPTPRSYQTILGDMINAFTAAQGITRLRAGSPILSILEAGSQSVLRSSQDIFQLLNSISLDTAEGLALEQIGADENAPKLTQSPSTGTVDIADTSFTKISTNLYQGKPAPIAGSVVLNVADASFFPSTGSVYVGRGTSDYEGPLAYTSKTNAGSYWQLNLSSGTIKFHNVSETVILAQGGNRVVAEKTVVVTQQANTSDALQFKTRFSTTIPDGETSITGVRVVAQTPGVIGNIPANAIKSFSTSPFTGATVTNPSPFSNGRDTETDDNYRERIRDIRRSRALGTALAITTAVTGITSATENKRVTSATLVDRLGLPSTLYVDDGTGLEEITAGVPVETLADAATGGEQYFEANQRPIARAFVLTLNSSPYALIAGSQLSVKVGGIVYNHLFNASDFTSIGGASAYEVVASINADPNIQFSARTVNGGSQVALIAKTDVNEDVEVVPPATGTDANFALAFPSGINYTAQLYKNDRLLNKDGSLAAYTSQNFSQWSAVTGSQTISISVDGTPAQTYTFVDQDFVDASTGFTVLGRNTIAAWIAVFNTKVPGITASENSGAMVLTSNAGRIARASVSVLGGSLITARFFSVGEAFGASNDYSLNRNTSQLALVNPLEAGDSLTIGSSDNRAFLESGAIGTASIASTAKLWFVVDGDASIVSTGVTNATTLAVAVSAIHDFGTILTLTSVGTPFNNVVAGDWVVIWDTAVDASLQGAFRVVASTGSTISIERRLDTGVRHGHRSAALAASGSNICKVLTCGGGTTGPTAFTDTYTAVTAAASVYNPNTQVTSVTNPMSFARAGHSATLVPSGHVIVVGGVDDSGTPLTSIEIYDPTSGTWTTSAGSLTVGVFNHVSTLLSDGTVLVTGGDRGASTMSKKVYHYDPVGDTVTPFSDMVTARSLHRAVLLPSNDVLIAGGFDNTHTPLVNAEIWSAGSTNCTATGSMHQGRADFGLATIGTSPTTAVAVGNTFGVTGNTTYEVYNIAGTTWGAATTIPANCTFENKDVTKITNGKVVGLYGYDSTAKTTSVNFTYDGTTWVTWVSNPLLVDTKARWRTQVVELVDGVSVIKNRVCSVGGLVQLSSSRPFQTAGIIEEYNVTTPGWRVPEPAATASVVLAQAGMAFARTDTVLREADVASGTNYTASSIVAVLDSELVGATAGVYKTNQLRVATNSFAKGRDISLVTQNVAAVAVQLGNSGAVDNLTGHVGSVESGNSELGTPSFKDGRVRATYKSGTNPESVAVDVSAIDPNYGLVGLRNWWRGANGTSLFDGASYFYPRAGSNFGFASRLRSSQSFTSIANADVRTAPIAPWVPEDRVYLAAPYAIGPHDDLTVMVDNDLGKRFGVNMWRILSTVGTTYSTTNTFRDGDAGSVSLALTFGLGYDFNDFTVYMSARAKAFTASNQQMLFRYYRLGPDGNDVRVKFGNPIGPNANLSVAVDMADATVHTNTTIRLQSGALRTPTVHTTTKLGQTMYAVDGGGIGSLVTVLNLPISSASRTTNVDTLTLTLPPSITDHGLAINDTVWVNSSNINFTSGLKTITGRSATTIQYAETAADQGATANIGTVSNDMEGPATYTGSSTVVTDFLRVVDPALLNAYGNKTFLISAVAVSGSYVQVTSGDQLDAHLISPSTTLAWTPVQAAANLQIFSNPAQTAATIVTELNALANAANSTCPINATLLGSGAGVIDRSTPDFLDSYLGFYTLTDGVNWVSVTTSPGSTAGDYTLTFKNPITGSLATGADWVNEAVRLCPSTTKNVVGWLNTPTVSGLFTVCSIQASNNGHNVQIATRTPGSLGGVQVQGGLSNTVTAAVVGSPVDLVSKSVSTIPASNSDGIFKGVWCRIQNENPLPVDGTFGIGMGLSSWGADGLLTFTAPVISPLVNPVQVKLQVERQGNFVAISDMGIDADISGFTSITPGSYVRITPAGSPTANFPQVSSANEGIFRVLRRSNGSSDSSGTLYIENGSSVDERMECTLAVYTSSTPVPGDQLVIASPIFGAGNQGTWTIKSVGTTTGTSTDSYANLDRFTVDISSRAPVPQGASLVFDSSSVDLVTVVQGTPDVYVMKVDSISPNQIDGNFTDIRWDLPIYEGSISGSAGSVITVLDKFDFQVDFSAGVDGYAYDVGLLGEVNRVVYGDPSDVATYPGVAAAGANINTSGPLVKRITIALALRVRSGVSNTGVANRVRSAVATAVNQSDLGQPISISSLVEAAERVVGVISVVPVSPGLNLSSDLIEISPWEKGLVLSLSDDIRISFLGD